MSATAVSAALHQLAETLAADVAERVAERLRSANVTAAKLAYSVPEAAKALGISASEVRRLIHGGELRALKAGEKGTKFVIPARELERYLREDA